MEQVRPSPIFDTNVFIDSASGAITPKEWSKIRRCCPKRGWPLSMITAAELLVGLTKVGNQMFSQKRKELESARQLSRARVLPEPRVLVCEELLGKEFPLEPPLPEVFTKCIEIVSRAKSHSELEHGKVLYKPAVYKGKRTAGCNLAIVEELLRGPKKQWTQIIAQHLDSLDATWRSRRAVSGSSLPEQLREKLKQQIPWTGLRFSFAQTLIQ